jgi:integrase
LIKIRKVVLKDGSVRYRARGVSVGKDPATGKRAQRTITCKTKHEVEAELRRIGHAVDRGTYQRPWAGLVPELIDSYLDNGADQWEANTRLSYANALQPAREWFAHRKARSVVREDVEAFKSHLLTSGRRRGGTPGTGLGPRSVNLTLGQLQSAFDLAERDGKVARNPVRFVKRVRPGERDRATWSEEQVRRFIEAAASDRLYACWLLSLLGFRRAEVLGARWSGANLLAGTITIARTRVLVNGQVIEKGPKSRRSARTLPLFEPVTGALEALYARQAAEKDAAGPAYAADVDSGYLAADELGQPLHPERYSDEFARLCREADVPVTRLHDTRASVNSLLEKLGVSDSLRAAWLGHTIAINRSAYLGAPRPEELAVISTALGRIFQAV